MRAAIFKGKGRILLAPRAGRSEAVRTLLHSLVERWASPAAFDAHVAQAAVRQAFDTDIVDLLIGPPVAHVTAAVTAAVTDPHRA